MRAATSIFVILVLLGGLLLAFDDDVEVCIDARAEAVDLAEVVFEAESGTNGATSLQLIQLVLDLGLSDAEKAVAEEGRRLRAAGWNVRRAPDGLVAHTQRLKVTAYVSTLEHDLTLPTTLESINAEIRAKLPRRDHLITVNLESSSCESICRWLPL